MGTLACQAISIGAFVILLTACGGSRPPIGAPAMAQSLRTSAGSSVFLHAHRKGYDLIYSFSGTPDGSGPQTGVVGIGSALYGTTLFGGANNFGTVFSITQGGTESVVYSFQRYDGWYPVGALLARKGSLYGTTAAGGSESAGTVFSITSGAESILTNFNETDGDEPWSGLVASSGTMYGTTVTGGSNDYGTVYALSSSGGETVLHNFGREPDGEGPNGPVIDVKGTLYGTTALGGGGSCSDGCGTIYSVDKSGYERVLYSFKGQPDGAGPQLGGLILVKGALYGTTESGGTSNAGTVFKVSLAGSESVVYSFTGSPDGESPHGTLVNRHGLLYGTTNGGGRSGSFGTIFSVTTSGKERVLYRFKGKPDGSLPQSALTLIGGTLYGTTVLGGIDDQGTVFSFRP